MGEAARSGPAPRCAWLHRRPWSASPRAESARRPYGPAQAPSQKTRFRKLEVCFLGNPGILRGAVAHRTDFASVDILYWSVAECEGNNRIRFFGEFSVKCLHNTLAIPIVSHCLYRQEMCDLFARLSHPEGRFPECESVTFCPPDGLAGTLRVNPRS
jgi:hypothetical protein